MADDSERGTDPVERATTGDPPKTGERTETEEEVATVEAGGEVVDRRPGGGVEIEGPNPA